MSEKRKKSATVLLKFQGKPTVKVEFFPAEAWAGKLEGAGPGLYRLRVDGAWRDGLYPEVDAFAALPVLAGEEAPSQVVPPELPKGSRVGVKTGNFDENGDPTYDVTFTMTPPFQGPDKRWRVFVLGRKDEQFVDELQERASK